ncbi:MAG TPA: hypothetical protein VIK73_06630, partial [Limnochordales bacterium]
MQMHIRRWLAVAVLVVVVVASMATFLATTQAYPIYCPTEPYEPCEDDGGGGSEGGEDEQDGEDDQGSDQGGNEGGDEDEGGGEPPPDTDGDGIPDAEDPDDDGDGYTDATETRAGTDGKDPDSTPLPVPDDVASLTSASGVPP